MATDLRALSACRLLAAIFIGAAATTAACQSSPADPHAEQPTSLEDVLIGPVQSIEAVPDDVQLRRPRHITLTYRQIAGEDHPRSIERKLVPDPNDPNAWAVHTPAFKKVRHLRRDNAGNVLLVAVEDLDRNVRTRFATPLVIMRPGLGAKAHETKSQVTVVKRDNPAHVVTDGEATMRIQCEGRQRLRTPAGEYNAYRIATVFQSNFTMASVTNRSTAYYAPEVGLVASRSTEKGVAALVPWTERRTLVFTAAREPEDE